MNTLPRFAFRAEHDASVAIDVVTGFVVARCEGDQHVSCCHKLVAALNGDERYTRGDCMIQTLLSVPLHGGRLFAKCPGNAEDAIAAVRRDDPCWDQNVRIHWTLDAMAPLERIRFWYDPVDE